MAIPVFCWHEGEACCVLAFELLRAGQSVASSYLVVAESEYPMRFVERIHEFIPSCEKFVWLLERKHGYGPIEMFDGSNSSSDAAMGIGMGRARWAVWGVISWQIPEGSMVNQGLHGIENRNSL